MNQDATFLPGRGNDFSLSPGERAGVRVSVKLIVPGAFTRLETRYRCRVLGGSASGARSRTRDRFNILDPGALGALCAVPLCHRTVRVLIIGTSAALVSFSQARPQSRMALNTGRSALPFSVSRYAKRFVPSAAGVCWMISFCLRRSSRSLKILVGMPSGEAEKSRKRSRPITRSRMIRSVQRSPTMSRQQATGQGERRSRDVVATEAGLRLVFKLEPPCHTYHLQTTSKKTCKKQVNRQ